MLSVTAGLFDCQTLPETVASATLADRNLLDFLCLKAKTHFLIHVLQHLMAQWNHQVAETQNSKGSEMSLFVTFSSWV